MNSKTLPRSIVIIGRRWYDRNRGSTYHSAVAIVDGEQVAHIERSYGYGDQYLHSAFDAIEAQGLLPKRERYKNGLYAMPWHHCEALGIKLHYEAADVARKRDL